MLLRLLTLKVDEEQLRERLERAPVIRGMGNPDTAVDNLFATASLDKNETHLPFIIETFMAWQFENTETCTISSRTGPDVQTTDREKTQKATPRTTFRTDFMENHQAIHLHRGIETQNTTRNLKIP